LTAGGGPAADAPHHFKTRVSGWTLFIIGKGRRWNPFDAGYDFIVLGYLSHPDNYFDSISEFNKLLQSFKMHD
jgi:hypothetical protein